MAPVAGMSGSSSLYTNKREWLPACCTREDIEVYVCAGSSGPYLVLTFS